MSCLWSFADWLKEQRAIRGISQLELCVLTNYRIPQSTISNWESDRTIPSVTNILILTKALKMKMSSVPWDDIHFDKSDKRAEVDECKERYSLYDLPKADSLKTFEGKIYVLKGFVGIEQETGHVEHITELYYRTRTVVFDNQVAAKRKNVHDELVKVSRIKKLKDK